LGDCLSTRANFFFAAFAAMLFASIADAQTYSRLFRREVDGKVYDLIISQSIGNSYVGSVEGLRFQHILENETILAVKAEYKKRYPNIDPNLIDQMFQDERLSGEKNVSTYVLHNGEIVGAFRAAIPLEPNGSTPGEQVFNRKFPRDQLPATTEKTITEDGQEWIEREVYQVWELKNLFIKRGSSPAVGALLMDIIGGRNRSLQNSSSFAEEAGTKIRTRYHAGRIIAFCSERIVPLHLEHGFELYQDASRQDRADVFLSAEPATIVEKFAGAYLDRVGAKPGDTSWYKALPVPKELLVLSHWQGELQSLLDRIFSSCFALEARQRYGTAYRPLNLIPR
jgi:hypothetical protein